MGLADKVRVLRTVSDVPPVLVVFDISVIASNAVETFPIAMPDSISMKVPIFGTDIDVMFEAVTHGVAAFVVSLDNENALAQNMLLALDGRGGDKSG